MTAAPGMVGDVPEAGLTPFWEGAAAILRPERYQPELERAAAVIVNGALAGGAVVCTGNGGSASTASHLAADLAKSTTPDGGRLRTIALSDNPALVTAWTNDVSWTAVWERAAAPWLVPDSVLVCISVHGGSADAAVSGNLGLAARLARERGASVIAFTGFGGGDLGGISDVHLNVAYDTEPWATPLIESAHVLLHHALCLEVRRQMAASA